MQKTPERTASRADEALAGSSRIVGLTRFLGGILFFALLHAPVHAGQSVTLAWDPSLDANVVGYALYNGTNSGSYQTRIDAGSQTSSSVELPINGVTYFLMVTAYTVDGLESLPSNEVSYTVPNNLPTIALTAPVSGANYTAPANISLAASVTANGHIITKVQFYNGATLLGEASSSPYAFTWSNVSSGSYSMTANAIYDSGSRVTSSPASVVVTTSLPGEPPGIGIRVAATGEAVLTVTGQIGHAYDIEATEDFTAWTVIGTIMLDASGSLDVTDMNAASFSQRFYRTREAQH